MAKYKYLGTTVKKKKSEWHSWRNQE
jgi:hypothetical protein